MLEKKQIVKSAFQRLLEHIQNVISFRFSMGMIDSMIAKYGATVIGFVVVSRPFLNPNHRLAKSGTHQQLIEHYYNNGRMLMNLAKAVGRVVLAGREITRLAGFTARVTELSDVLSDLEGGNYQRTMITDGVNSHTANSGVLRLDQSRILFKDVPLVTPNGDTLVPKTKL